MEIAERRAKVAQMLSGGWSFRTIAAQLNCSLGTVAEDRAALMREWRQAHVDRIDESVLLDLHRLDTLIQHLTIRIAQDEDPSHIMTLLAVLKRRASILGYDAADRARSGLQIAPPETVIDVDSTGVLTPDGRPVANRDAARIYAAFASPKTERHTD